jgi:methyl-accepting chemotaxis protein
VDGGTIMLKNLWDQSKAHRVAKQAEQLIDDIYGLPEPRKSEFFRNLHELHREIVDMFSFDDAEDLKLLVKQERDFARRSLRDYTEALSHGFFSTYAEALLVKETINGYFAFELLNKILNEMRQELEEASPEGDHKSTDGSINKDEIQRMKRNFSIQFCRRLSTLQLRQNLYGMSMCKL